MQFKLIPLIIIAAVTSVQAQEIKEQKKSDSQPQPVVNEDRGQAFIITNVPVSFSEISKKEKIVDPRQHSIFLGTGWQADLLRDRQPELANLLINTSDQLQINALEKVGIRNFFPSTTYQEKYIEVENNRHLTDLEIQRIIEEMFKNSLLTRPVDGTVYVVFLDPELHSTLGSMFAGKHYLAYHNFFNWSGMKIPYVVVPFEGNQKRAYQIALYAFLSAVSKYNLK